MLVEFRVTNFRSIDHELVLSLVASGAASDKKEHPECLIRTGVKPVPNLVPVVVMYGANASGKSNVLKALEQMKEIVKKSFSTSQKKMPYQPFKFAKTSTSEIKTEFEATFIIDGVRHQYGFSYISDRVIDEWLLVYKNPKPQTWIDRSYDEDSDSYTYADSKFLTGNKKIWEESTRKNALFLSTANALNSDLLVPIYNWFATDSVDTYGYSERKGKKELNELLKVADVGISDFSIKESKVEKLEDLFKKESSLTRGYHVEQVDDGFRVREVSFLHKTDNNSVVLDISDESDGTRKYFDILGGLLETLECGLVLLVDELDRSLHPLLVKRVIEMFQSPLTNPKGAQLIFNTHDTTLLDNALFRRDQIWFVEKKPESQSTELYPLTDFSPRKNSALTKGYLEGRYGAIPFLGDMNNLFEDS